MADQLYLSYWLRGFTEFNMLRHLETALRRFPFSRLSPGILLRIHALSFTEPLLLEQSFAGLDDSDQMLSVMSHYRSGDVAYQVEGKWDIWQRQEEEWKLVPAPVALYAFAPGFERERDEQIRVDFGLDFHFLPQPEQPGSARLVESNIRSLLSLVHDLDNNLAVERRQLWSESGENFAERLQTALREVG